MNRFVLIRFKIIATATLLLLFPVGIFAQVGEIVCSPVGYSIFTINGIFTNKEEAAKNKRELEDKLDKSFNNQPLTIDYLHNPSHIAGLGDLVMSTYQKIFDYEAVEDYDLVEMLKDASAKVKTQKLLLVAHSQGNFYANSFYDTVAGKNDGVPKESIGVYAVATPASRVAGEGKWFTSDTDKIIADLVALFPFKKIMAPNTSIVLAEGDDSQGHNFSGVYLKHRGSQIVFDIQSSLDKLQTNSIQNESSSCFEPPKLTLAHKVEGAILSVVDPVANTGKDVTIFVATGVYQAGSALAKRVYSLTNFIAGATASVLSGDNKNTNNEAVALKVINSENISNEISSEGQTLIAPKIVVQENKPLEENVILSSDNFSSSSVSFFNSFSSVSSSAKSPAISSAINLVSEPKFSVTDYYPGFGGGGGSGAVESPSSASSIGSSSSASESSSLSSSSSVSSTSSSSSSSESSLPADLPAEEEEEAGSSSNSSSSSVSDTAPPTISSFSISECQQTLSSDSCLVATTTLNIAWNSLSADLDYFVINQNGAIRTTTATSTNVIASDNAIFSFAVSAKDLAGNFSATSTQTAEVSLMPVVINEVAWAGNSSAYSADEWIELYNRTSKTINLTDWILYSKTNLTPYINLSGQIASKGYYLLERTKI